MSSSDVWPRRARSMKIGSCVPMVLELAKRQSRAASVTPAEMPSAVASLVMVIPTRNWRYSPRLLWNYTVTYAKRPTSPSAWLMRWISTWKCSTSKPISSVTCTAGHAGRICSVMPKPNTGIILSWMSAPCGGCGRREGEDELLDDMDLDRYDKVKCSKIEGMLPKLMKMVEGEMRSMR